MLDIGSDTIHLVGGEDGNIYSLCLDKLPSKQEELDDCLKLVSQGTHSLPLLQMIASQGSELVEDGVISISFDKSIAYHSLTLIKSSLNQ